MKKIAFFLLLCGHVGLQGALHKAVVGCLSQLPKMARQLTTQRTFPAFLQEEKDKPSCVVINHNFFVPGLQTSFEDALDETIEAVKIPLNKQRIVYAGLDYRADIFKVIHQLFDTLPQHLNLLKQDSLKRRFYWQLITKWTEKFEEVECDTFFLNKMLQCVGSARFCIPLDCPSSKIEAMLHHKLTDRNDIPYNAFVKYDDRFSKGILAPDILYIDNQPSRGQSFYAYMSTSKPWFLQVVSHQEQIDKASHFACTIEQLKAPKTMDLFYSQIALLKALNVEPYSVGFNEVEKILETYQSAK